MEEIMNKKYKAIYHNDWLLDGKQQTRQYWQRYANKMAKKETGQTKFMWHGIVAFIEDRNAYRVSLAGQPDKV